MLAKTTAHYQQFIGTDLTLSDLIKLRAVGLTIDLSSYHRSQNVLAGMQSSYFRGRGMDFDEVRHYLPGDDIRTVEWRVTARTGTPHTKIYREERERPVLFVMDFSPNMYFGTRVTFKSITASLTAATLAWACQDKGDRIGGILFTNDYHSELRPQGGERGVLGFLRKLIEYNQQLQQTHQSQENFNAFANNLKRLRYVVRPGSLILIFSDFYNFNDDAKKHLQQLSRHNDIICLFIYDPLEKLPPPPNYYTITDGNKCFSFNSQQKEFKQHYQQMFLNREQKIKTICDQHQLSMISIATDDLLPQVLYKHLGKKNR